MITDKQLMFSEGQALTASAASTNIIDFGASKNISAGQELFYFIRTSVNADYTSTNETYAVKFETDDDSAFGSATNNGGPNLTYADLVTTNLIIGRVPFTAKERYMRMYWTLGGTTPSVTVYAGLCLNIRNTDLFASGWST